MWNLIKNFGGTALSALTGGGFSWGLVLVAVLACVGSYFCGRHDGPATATALGDAKYSKLETSIANANRLASKAAKEILDAEIKRRDEAETSLLAARETIAAQSRKITNRRIADASRTVVIADGHCTFGPAWMQLWNESMGLGSGDPARTPAAPGPAGAAR